MGIFRQPLSDVHHFLGQGQVGHVRGVGVVVVRVLGVAHGLLGRVPLVGPSEIGLAVLNVPAERDEALQSPPNRYQGRIL